MLIAERFASKSLTIFLQIVKKLSVSKPEPKVLKFMNKTCDLNVSEAKEICSNWKKYGSKKELEYRLLLLNAGYCLDFIEKNRKFKKDPDSLFGGEMAEEQKKFIKSLNSVEKEILRRITVRFGSKYIGDYIRTGKIPARFPFTYLDFPEVGKKYGIKKSSTKELLDLVIEIIDGLFKKAPKTKRKYLMFRGIEDIPEIKEYINKNYLFVSRDPYVISSFISSPEKGSFLRIKIPRGMPLIFLEYTTSFLVSRQKSVLFPRNLKLKFEGTPVFRTRITKNCGKSFFPFSSKPKTIRYFDANLTH